MPDPAGAVPPPAPVVVAAGPAPSVPDPARVGPPPGPDRWEPPRHDAQPEPNKAVLVLIGVMVAVVAVFGGYSLVGGGEDDDSAVPGPLTDQPSGGDDTGTDLPSGGQDAGTDIPPSGEGTGDADASADGATDSSEVDDGPGDDTGAATTEPPALGTATSPPTGGWIPFHDELAQSCHGGNMFDCDYLYGSVGAAALPDSQPHKDYAATCGGRIAEPAEGSCEDWYGSAL